MSSGAFRRRGHRTAGTSRCWHLPEVLADLVRFLFFSAWRAGEARMLEWRDYDRADGAIRLRAERSKNKHGRVLPLVGELEAIIARRLEARRLDCRPSSTTRAARWATPEGLGDRVHGGRVVRPHRA